ncbi:hypothetical protein ABT095_37140 [Kitasatospora sp. NPDC002227]|uniref:hypothetical protein n=1 Tax=Kitasatospora sp. NPDC002227 TaxID=3154773 RepID=UPI003321EC1B
MTEPDEALRDALILLADRQSEPGPVPVAALLHRGRRTRRRRALGASAAAVCAVALIGAGAVATKPDGPDPRPAAGTVSSTPEPDVHFPVPADARQLLALLPTKLPASFRYENHPMKVDADPHDPRGRRAMGAYTIKDGSRTGTVGIEVVRAAVPQKVPPRPAQCTPSDCTFTQQPDGGALMVLLGGKQADGAQQWLATLIRPDGTTVTASTGNVPLVGSDPHTPYPNGPLLDGAQLTALVLDPLWQEASDSMLAP